MAYQQEQLPNYADYGSLLQVFEKAVDRHTNKLFIRYQLANAQDEFRTLTYGQAHEITAQLAKAWKPSLNMDNSNVKQRSTIAIFGDNPIQYIFTFLTAMKLGLIFLPLSPQDSNEAITHLLKETHTTHLITSSSYKEKAQKCVGAMLLSSPNSNITMWDGFDINNIIDEVVTAMDLETINDTTSDNDSITRKRLRVEEGESIGPDDTVVYMQTSGSTGIPKAIGRSSRVLLYAILETLMKSIKQTNKPELELVASDVLILPLASMQGPSLVFLISLMVVGASILVFDQQETESKLFMASAEKYCATLLISPPKVLEQLNDYLNQELQGTECFVNERQSKIKGTFERIKFCLVYGAPLRKPVGNYLRTKGLNVQNMYGTTETGIISLSNISKENNDLWYSICPTSEFKRYASFEPLDDTLYQLVLRTNLPSLYPEAVTQSKGDYYATKDLFIKEKDEKFGENWTYIGRLDDALNTLAGDKVIPTPMEKEICNEEIVRNCTIIGEYRETLAVLIELDVEKAVQYSPLEMVSKVHESVDRANQCSVSYSIIQVPSMVYILPLNKQLPTNRKGAVMRGKAIDLFTQEIEQLYSNSVACLAVKD